MVPVVQTHLGKDRRIAFPSRFCKEANLHPGTAFFVSREGSKIVLSPVIDEAEQIRSELRAMLPTSQDLLAELRDMRARDADDETHHRR